MIDIFDSVARWSNVANSANLTRDTTNHLVGTGCLSFDKTGTSSVYGTVGRTFQVPIPLRHLMQSGCTHLAFSVRHPTFTGLQYVRLAAVYSDGSYDYRDYQAISLTGGSWNTITLSLKSPSATAGSPTNDERNTMVGVRISGITALAAGTFSGLLVDAIRLEGGPYSVLTFGGMRLPVPVLDDWQTTDEETVQTIEAQSAIQTVPLRSRILVDAGYRQARGVYDQTSEMHGLEDSLRLFDRYTAANHGWGLIRNGNQIIDTALTNAAAAGATTLTLDSITDVAYLSDAADVRIGPNDSGQYEVAKVISRASSVVTLDRELFYSYEAGSPLRSLGNFPMLYRRQTGAYRPGAFAGFKVQGVSLS